MERGCQKLFQTFLVEIILHEIFSNIISWTRHSEPCCRFDKSWCTKFWAVSYKSLSEINHIFQIKYRTVLHQHMVQKINITEEKTNRLICWWYCGYKSPISRWPTFKHEVPFHTYVWILKDEFKAKYNKNFDINNVSLHWMVRSGFYYFRIVEMNGFFSCFYQCYICGVEQWNAFILSHLSWS